MSKKDDALLTEIESNPLVVMDSGSRYHLAYIGGGLVLLFVGGEMTVRYSVAFATVLGVSTTLVGLFVVAVGTSLPELAVTVVSALRGEYGLALGNIVGSNIFNIFFVLGISSVIGSGIFLTPSQIAGHLPTPLLILLVWAIGGVITLTGALTFAELGSMFPEAGGVYVYLKEAYGGLFGFLYGWVYLVVITSGANAALSIACAYYLAFIFPMSQTGITITDYTDKASIPVQFPYFKCTEPGFSIDRIGCQNRLPAEYFPVGNPIGFPGYMDPAAGF